MPINFLHQNDYTTAHVINQPVQLNNFVYNQSEQVQLNNNDVIIPEIYSVQLLSQIFEELDYSELFEAYSSKGRNPAVDPKSLFIAVAYANINGIVEFKLIVRAFRKDINLKQLLDGEKAPNYSDIKLFRKGRVGKAVEKLYSQFINILLEQYGVNCEDLFSNGALDTNSGAELAFHKLDTAINFVIKRLTEYVNRPGKDFTRQSPISFRDLLWGILGMGGESIDREILYGALDGLYDDEVPTPSAFVQRRACVKPEAFETVYREHAKTFSARQTWRGRRIFAEDGSDLVYMEDSADPDCHYEGYNKIHLDALYDLINDYYADVSIALGRKVDEREAAAKMAARFPKTEGSRPIMTADRGFEAYNLMAHLEESSWDFLIRVKDINSTGILSGLSWVTEEGAFDKDVRLLLTRRQTKEMKSHPEIYKILSSQTKFDFLEDRDTYEIQFRAVRIMLPNGEWECLLTNLIREEFPPDVLFELYGMRWGIETSFRLLKNALCLKNFHARKRDSILQETYAKLTMYNYCSESIYLSTGKTRNEAERVLGKKSKDPDAEYISKPNFTFLASLCMRIVRGSEKALVFANGLFRKVKTLVKQNRSFERGKITTGPVPFQYRMT